MPTVCKHADADRSGQVAESTLLAAVIDPQRVRLERLAEEIAAQLVAHHGGVTRLASAVEDVALWRRAARRAGRILGVPVRTGVAPDGSKVWAVDES